MPFLERSGVVFSGYRCRQCQDWGVLFKKKHNFLSSNQLKNKTPLVNQLKLQGA